MIKLQKIVIVFIIITMLMSFIPFKVFANTDVTTNISSMSPKTGDIIIVYIAVFVIAIAGFISVIIIRKKSKKKKITKEEENRQSLKLVLLL